MLDKLINTRQQAGSDLHSGALHLRSGPLLGRYVSVENETDI